MQYSKKVLQHFMNPKNQGRLKNPDGFGTVGNPACGDIMTVYIKVKKIKGKPRSRTSSLRGKLKGKEIISDIKFETLGCAAAIATSSMVTEMAKGRDLAKAAKITRQDVATSLEGLPPAKMHCSNLAADALKRAIEDYRSKSRKEAKKPARTRKRARRR
ncbi:MAG: iron-sulfur cluster assembly scaffold protein [Patescibacteria group bacterium]|nr:iron-sulfur cluster assembly scaffold protein [Patescibacteria group bacterium]